MKQIKLINPDNISDFEAESFKLREAARAVVFDENGMIALLFASKDDYYKLPGGGIEDTEDKIVALKRECLEEIGCNVDVVNEIGLITEYRNKSKLKQISYCYLVKVNGKKGKPSFTEDEIKNGFREVWLSYEDATRALNKINTTNFVGGTYIAQRDQTFLKEARVYLDKYLCK
ncbi:MAG: NUDIX domain-containing protein [Candidatus Paceibacterota bacterium]|jgi:8-oxo-dGTP pyrophosphatase MutT (NUDIX family)